MKTRMNKFACLGAIAATCALSNEAASVTQDWLASPNQSNTATDAWQFFQDISGVQPGGVRSGSYGHVLSYAIGYPAAGLESWASGYPIVGKNTSGSTVNDGTVVWPAEQVFMHPAVDFSIGVGIGYLVPAAGQYDISGYLQPLHSGGVNWYLDVNALNLASGDTLDLGRDDFSLSNVSLNAGDKVYLIIGNAGDYSGDTTGVDLVINPSAAPSVPDGGSTALLFLTAFGTVRLVRRRS